jgi:NDP-sugar pyrophosphorylase family protein
MRVMIMAAGKGTRLRPITDSVPKPMAPVVNRPALHHILRLLSRHGLRQVVINLHHLPDAIVSYVGDGSWLGMEITYSHEPKLLGTSGGVKNNEGFLGGGTFLVMSGDALTDIDLTGLIAAHRRNGSIATLAVKEVADPSLYGVLVLDDDQRVMGFQEKPSLAEARSRLCNCGIYVLEPEIFEYIPAGRFDDFGSRLLPDLLAAGIPFHAEPIDAYWSDVGSLTEYFRGNADALLGRVEVEKPGTEIRPGIWIGASADIAGSARLEPPLVIGRDCVIGENAAVEGPAVIGSGSHLGDGCHVFRAVILPRSQVPEGSVAAGGVLGHKLGPEGRET